MNKTEAVAYYRDLEQAELDRVAVAQSRLVELRDKLGRYDAEIEALFQTDYDFWQDSIPKHVRLAKEWARSAAECEELPEHCFGGE